MSFGRFPAKKATRRGPIFASQWMTAKAASPPPRTLNEVKDTARFPIIESSPDGNLLVAWIDRRIDNPKPRQLYLMRIGADGKALTKNYPVGEGLCECCKLGIAFADGGKTSLYGRPRSRRQANSQSRPAQIDRRRRHVRRAGAKSATTAGKFPPARTRGRASGATVAASFMSVGSRSAARKKKPAFTTACPKTTAKASRRGGWCRPTPRRKCSTTIWP